MNLPQQHRSTRKSRGRTNRFQELRDRALHLQTENEKLTEDLETLVGQVQAALAPARRELAATSREFILYLLPFLHRKSLAKWEREEIREWVAEQMEIVVPAGLVDDELREALARDTALQMGYRIEEDSELSAHEQVEAAFSAQQRESETIAQDAISQLFDEEVEEMVRRKFGKRTSRPTGDDLFQDELDAAWQQREAEIEAFRREAAEEVRQRFAAEFGGLFDDEFGECGDAMAGEEEIDETGSRPEIAQSGRDIMSRLFRRTANVLHPDKERDDARRARKQTLMGALLEARRKGDILTVFRLHQEHVDGDVELSAKDEEALLTALSHRVEALERERDEIINRSAAHAHAYASFFGHSKGIRKRRINQFVDEIRARTRGLQQVIREVRTLKALKPVLEERAEERYLDEALNLIAGDAFRSR